MSYEFVVKREHIAVDILMGFSSNSTAVKAAI
jgi:hypothetical protein